MNVELSTRVQNIKPSPTLAIASQAAALRAAGKNIINMGVGEPDFDTPEHIKAAAIDAIKNGATKYTAVDGTVELKQAIINKFSKDNQLDYELNQILVSTGAKQSLYNIMQALLQAGDEVIIPAPYWVSYPAMVILADATPVIVAAPFAQQFKITPEQLKQAITAKTRLVLLNSPSNPSGVTYTKAELTELGQVLLEHPEIIVITDDMYEHILWSDEPFSNILNACPALKERTIVVNGASKAYAMTGWRIGYAAGPSKIIAAMKKIQSQSTSNACSVSQAATVAALSSDQQCVKNMVKAYKERHDFVYEKLQAIPGIKCHPCNGTFYTFPQAQQAIDKLGLNNDVDFASHLLENAGVAVVPGSAFGTPGAMRLSYALGLDALDDALNRIKQAIG